MGVHLAKYLFFISYFIQMKLGVDMWEQEKKVKT